MRGKGRNKNGSHLFPLISLLGGRMMSRSQGFGRKEMFLEVPCCFFRSRREGEQAENLAAEVAASPKCSESPVPAEGEGLALGNR